MMTADERKQAEEITFKAFLKSEYPLFWEDLGETHIHPEVITSIIEEYASLKVAEMPTEEEGLKLAEEFAKSLDLMNYHSFWDAVIDGYTEALYELRNRMKGGGR